MNDFTKEELNTIVDAFNLISGAPSWRNTEGWDDALQNKIQSMIDNYCECLNRTGAIDEDGHLLVKCTDCDRVFWHEKD